MTDPTPLDTGGRPLLGGLPVDPQARDHLARLAGAPVPPPDPDSTVAPCIGCGTRIWLGPGQTALARADAACPACPTCAARHGAALQIAADRKAFGR